MAVFQVVVLFIFILGLARRFGVRFVEAVPAAVSIQVLLLYGLCFFNGLWLWDYISAAITAGAVVFILRQQKQRKKELLSFAKKELLDAGAVTAVALSVIVTFGVLAKPVSWWDDYNFWAADVKSIFYLDGFAQKHANVAAEFGDYPPGTQMMKWWFLHFSPKEFKEGLMFAGYYFMNMSFLFPFLKYLKKRNPLWMIFGGGLIWMFPSVAEAFWADGCCADLTMALAYGAFLVSVVEENRENSLWYYGRQALYLMIVVLCKNTGFIWAAFGLLFTYGYHFFLRKKDREREGKRRALGRGLLAVTLFPVLAGGMVYRICPAAVSGTGRRLLAFLLSCDAQGSQANRGGNQDGYRRDEPAGISGNHGESVSGSFFEVAAAPLPDACGGLKPPGFVSDTGFRRAYFVESASSGKKNGMVFWNISGNFGRGVLLL